MDRANTELVRWFGGRAAEQSSMDVGLPYRLKDGDAGVTGSSCGASLAAGKGRKGKRGGGGGKVLVFTSLLLHAAFRIFVWLAS